MSLQFKELAHYFQEIEITTSRLEMTKLLSELFKTASVTEIGEILYLLQGRVAPEYKNIEFNMGEKMVINASARAVGVDKQMFTKSFKKHGDIGLAVMELKRQQVSFFKKDLSVSEVFGQLKRLAESEGPGSQELKIAILSGLIQELDPLSARFVVRIPINKLRLGFSDMTILDAFSWMLTGGKELRGAIEGAYHVRPDIGYIGTLIKKYKDAKLQEVQPVVFTPIIMMRAERLSVPEEILAKAEDGFIEPKYDGFRLQIHAQGGRVALYSRSLEDVTHMYPDIVLAIKKEMKYKDIILEGEAIGFNPKTGELLPFQETVQRKRKYDIEAKAIEIPLKLFVFELLYLNGKVLLHESLESRRTLLGKLIKETSSSNIIYLAPETRVRTAQDVKEAFENAVAENLEGIMIKRKEGTYQPGARNWNWIKYKRSYQEKIDDTIDCLVMGYDVGQGKRTGFGIGALLIGIYDENEDMFKTVSKLGTGLTDEEWRSIKASCDEFVSKQKPYNYDVDKQMEVDVWVKPAIVIEIRSDEISRSSMHTAGRKMKKTKTGNALEVETSGYALRFPRLERMRDDKRPDDATTVDEVRSLFKLQKK